MPLYNIDYVIPNKFSRPQYKLLAVRGIVVHWTADPGATDENEAEFFDGADGGGGRAASAHMFVDKDSATLIVPVDEVAYHANEKPCRIPKLKGAVPSKSGIYAGDANVTTLGIEMCVEKDGTIHPDTLSRTISIVAEWCKTYGLSSADIYRHYDITGKNCPAPFVKTPSLFTAFKAAVDTLLAGGDKEMKLTDAEVDFILAVLSFYWGEMAGNKQVQANTHYVSNRVRKESGRPMT